MKFSYKNIKQQVSPWIGGFAIVLSVLFTSCDSGVREDNRNTSIDKDETNRGMTQDNDDENSNVNVAQDEIEVDTTASASYGQTKSTTGRADTDTSKIIYDKEDYNNDKQ